MIKISCIVPAYNEGDRIGNVLGALKGHPLIDELIVVDDGSEDSTLNEVKKFDDIRLIVHEKNRGKSAAIHTGVMASRGEHIMFIDSDLIGLNVDNITDLIKPVCSGISDVSISIRGNSPRLWRVLGMDYISGERVFPKKLLIDRLDEILIIPHFGLEVFLNELIIKSHMRIKIVNWPNVRSPYKNKKYGLWKGLRGDISMIMDIFRTITPFGPLYQIAKMLRLRV